MRNNKGNVKKMSKEIWVILHYYSNTIEKPMHSNCPTGSHSWCSIWYKPLQTFKISNHRLYSKSCYSIFKRLGDEAFSEGCKNVSNQNANESLNNVLSLTTSLAISLGDLCLQLRTLVQTYKFI